MKIPLNPPNVEQLFARLTPNELAKIFQHSSPLAAGKYLHWDDLRHRPPPEGLSSEKWWLAVSLARGSIFQPLPLTDKEGNPFRLATPEPLLLHLHHIDRDAAGQIKTPASSSIHENRERYVLHSLIEESITSSQLEGASTTRRVAEQMLREGRRPRDTSERMIFNNFRAMEMIHAMRDEAITPERILEIHRLVSEGTLDDPGEAGRFRQDDEVEVRDRQDNRLLHKPPRWQELPERLERLCAFANLPENSTPYIHPVLRAILLHFMIGYDHPFADGNGRTARALFYWAMAKSGYWLVEFISISHFLRQAPGQYVSAYLHTETDDNDATYFAIHQLTTMRKASDAVHAYLTRKSEEQHQTERLMARSSALRARLNHRQITLLTHALRHPGEEYRVDSHQRTHGVVYQTARADLLGLEALGLLLRSKIGNAFHFTPIPDLRERIEALAATPTAGQGWRP